MKAAALVKMAAMILTAGFAATVSHARTVIDADFSKGNFKTLDWQATGAWDIFQYPNAAAHNVGPVARFAVNQPEGALTKTFETIKNPANLSLSLEYGWGWGDADQGADAVSWMLLDADGNGYVFEVHRCKALGGAVGQGRPRHSRA